MQYRLYNTDGGSDSCGVGFITRKDSTPTHDLMKLGNDALCVVPHRGGMDAYGIGDGGGVLVDLSESFFSKIVGENLTLGHFVVGHFFMPKDTERFKTIYTHITHLTQSYDLEICTWRKVPVNKTVVSDASAKANPPIYQVVLKLRTPCDWQTLEHCCITIVEKLGETFYPDTAYQDFFPISFSSRTVVYKGRLNSHEVVPFFDDLMDPDFKIKIFLFHTRFSTNTAPRASMAQPFSRMAHNGELNTDKKNRIHEDSILRTQEKSLITPIGQSDSARMDQTLARRLRDDNLNIVEAFIRISPPAWENNPRITGGVRDMLEFFSLDEEKTDGPAAMAFTDGIRVGAKLDRLGLRPLRQTETTHYISVMSEAGQNIFPPSDVISRGRIASGDMVVYDHSTQKYFMNDAILTHISKQDTYSEKLAHKKIHINDLADVQNTPVPVATYPETVNGRMVAYGHNAESFRFMVDPILENGAERVSAMGYGVAINPLNPFEGGISRYFSQRFAQVTNPPLDSIREADGMTCRVALGAKPAFSPNTKQIILDTPILSVFDLQKIRTQSHVHSDEIPSVFKIHPDDNTNAKNLQDALESIAKQAVKYAQNNGIIIVSDTGIDTHHAPIPVALAVASINKGLVDAGMRFKCSFIMETGQVLSSHDMAITIGFGASAVCPTSVYERACNMFPDDIQGALNRYRKGCEKALMKTMGKFGLCTVESYTGGEFFEGNFLDTKNDTVLRQYFPKIDSPLGGVGFSHIATNYRDWFNMGCKNPDDIPSLGLFKEKSDTAGHSYGVNATKEFFTLANEDIVYAKDAPAIPKGTWILEEHLQIAKDIASYTHGKPTEYLDFGYTPLQTDFMDTFTITEDYRTFSSNLMAERKYRPSALRDILGFPIDMKHCKTQSDFENVLQSIVWDSISHATLRHIPQQDTPIYDAFVRAVKTVFGTKSNTFLKTVQSAPHAIDISTVQSASSITKTFASGAMSFGALNRNAHEAVALGTNLVHGASNCGEGGEQYARYNTPKSSSVKQIASGRFGVWAGYFADPNLREIEIKLAQGAKPGEGGQLPSQKVTVEIASMRGGTPMVELVSPPPHHDTYSIEDLAQLIHDAHSARVKVIVKLVSSEGIGTIAIGVAKAGADIINVAGNSGGTGAAQVTSLKNTGRVPEIGIAEVHQALCDAGLRNKVILRNSGALQNGYDVIKSCILGADSFEFGTTALMMIGCVMAKNCNIKCPAGLTTDPEVFTGDGRALAQYFLNIAHETREILATLGFTSLSDIRGRTELLHVLSHPDLTGHLDCRALLTNVTETIPKKPKYIQACFAPDDAIIDRIKHAIRHGTAITLDYGKLQCCNKSVGGQTAIDIERFLSWEMNDTERKKSPCITTNGKRPVLQDESVILTSCESAGQSYGVFLTTGMKLIHTGICNDGVGKSMCGGTIVIKNPGMGTESSVAQYTENTLIGNFALFGATGGKLFVNGGAGDRFAVRNTGALAVVEGIGDFGCEYMINGTVMNLGKFGKGFGNGMSGGNAYQYDPDGALQDLHSKDSVSIVRLDNPCTHTAYHVNIVKDILQQHYTHTTSDTAKHILNNWETEMGHFYVINPLAIIQTQCPDYLAHHSPAKVLSDELFHSYTISSIRAIKKAYQTNTPILDGHIPQDTTQNKNTQDKNTIDLITQFGIMCFAKKRALKVLQNSNMPLDEAMINITAKKLIITEDKDIISDCLNALKSDIHTLSKDVLGAWLSQKRIDDYVESLNGRDTTEIYNAGMMAWIHHTTAKNKRIIDTHGTIGTHAHNIFIKNLVKSTDLDTMALNHHKNLLEA